MRLMMHSLMLILLCLPIAANAYQRNQARPVEKVVFGQVESVRGLTEQQRLAIRPQGYRSLLGSMIGGAIGHQFGSGRGQVLATATGAIVGAVMAQPPKQPVSVQYQLVELLIRTEDDQLIDVIQDYDPNMQFNAGSSVRILYFSDGVRVDLTY